MALYDHGGLASQIPKPINEGGTGSTTAPGAANNILPDQTGNSGKVLGTNGSNVSWVTGGSGGGSVDSVTGLNTDNTDPTNPIVKISVDGVTITGAGTPGSPLVSSGSGSSAFSAITGGTNTSAAMVVGTGASLAVSGSGTIAATSATVATNVTVTNEGTDATCFPTFTTAATGDLPPKSNASLTFNASTGALGATSFSGAGTGLTGTASSLTAGTVTTNANLTGVITSVGNATSIASQTGTGTKFVVDTSPVLITPNIGVATATSVTSGAFISNNADPADSGLIRLGNAETIAWEANPTGTDLTLTMDANNVLTVSAPINATTGFRIGNAASSGKFLIGNGTNFIASTSTIPTSAGATANKVLLSDGTNYVLSTPTFPNASATSGKIIVSDGTNWTASTPTYPNASATAGKVIRSDGTNFAASTFTIPDTYSQGDIIYASGASVFSALAKNASSTRYLSNTGASNNPAWAQIDLSNGVTGTLPVGNGGTGQVSLTNHGVLVGAATSGITQLAAAASGTVLTGQGASADPSFSATPTLGVAGTTAGSLNIAGVTSGTVTVKTADAAGTWTMKLPTSGGSSGQLLKTDGTGITSWVAGSGPLIYSNSTPSSVASTASETAFAQTYTIPASSLAASDVLRIYASGVYSNTLTPTIEFKLKAGSTVLLDSTAITTIVNQTNAGWEFQAYIFATSIGASAALEVQGYTELSTALTTVQYVDLVNTSTITVDSTASQAISLTVQWSASSASNTITCRQFAIEKMNTSGAGVTGPGTSTDTALARWNGTTGQALSDSGVLVDSNNTIAGYKGNINAQSGTTYTLAASDTGKIVELNNASAITVTLPNSLAQGFMCTAVQTGAGQVTLSPAAGATLHNRSSFTKTAGQYAMLSLYVTTNAGGASAVYNMAGDGA